MTSGRRDPGLPASSGRSSQADAEETGRAALIPALTEVPGHVAVANPRDRFMRPAGPTHVTQPELAAVRLSEPPSSRLSIDGMDFDDTERVTDFGRPSVLTEGSSRPLLLRLDGIEAGRVYALPEGTARIGRHPEAEICIHDPGLSRYHAQIVRGQGLFVVQDLGSRNGTFRSGQRIDKEPMALMDGSWIQLGPRVCLRFALVDERQEQLLCQMYEGAKRDALTGIANRRHFEESLEAEVSYSRRNQVPLSLLVMDIDFFKKVNDQYGHPVGDAVLRYVAALAQQKLRTEDLLARFGGEEFVVIIRGMGLDIAQRVAERLRSSIFSRPVLVEKASIPVSISIGCSSLVCCGAEQTPAKLLEIADRRLYLAKNSGRNRVVAVG